MAYNTTYIIIDKTIPVTTEQAQAARERVKAIREEIEVEPNQDVREALRAERWKLDTEVLAPYMHTKEGAEEADESFRKAMDDDGAAKLSFLVPRSRS